MRDQGLENMFQRPASPKRPPRPTGAGELGSWGAVYLLLSTLGPSLPQIHVGADSMNRQHMQVCVVTGPPHPGKTGTMVTLTTTLSDIGAQPRPLPGPAPTTWGPCSPPPSLSPYNRGQNREIGSKGLKSKM